MDSSKRGNVGAGPRVLEYRKQIKITNILLKYSSLVYFIVFFVLIVLFLKWNIGLPELIGSFLMWLIMYGEYRYLIKPMAISKVQVYPDRIYIDQGKEKITIPFDDVAEIKSVMNKYTGGWFKLVLKNKKTYRFTIILERVDYLLDGIIKYRPELMSQESYKILRKNLILADHSTARLYDLFSKKNLFFVFLNMVLIPVLLTALLFIKQSSDFFIYHPFLYYSKTLFLAFLSFPIVSSVFVHFVNVAMDKTEAKEIEEKNNKKRDTKREMIIFRKFFYSYFLVLLAIFSVTYYFDFNVIIRTKVADDIDYLNMSKGTYSIDTRYNCTNCKFSIQKGDVLQINNDSIGRVIAIPGEKIVVHELNMDGRYVASPNEVKISQDSLVVLSYEGEVNLLVPFKGITGKVLLGESQR